MGIITKIKLFALLLLLPVISVALCSCDDNDDDVMDTKLIKGQWEVVDDGNQEYTLIYDFATQSENTFSWGVLTTYHLTNTGNQVLDKTYDWHVADPNNSDPVYLDITTTDVPDDEDIWESTDMYIVEKLTASEMVLKKLEVGNSQTRIKFIRRNDLLQP